MALLRLLPALYLAHLWGEERNREAAKRVYMIWCSPSLLNQTSPPHPVLPPSCPLASPPPLLYLLWRMWQEPVMAVEHCHLLQQCFQNGCRQITLCTVGSHFATAKVSSIVAKHSVSSLNWAVSDLCAHEVFILFYLFTIILGNLSLEVKCQETDPKQEAKI